MAILKWVKRSMVVMSITSLAALISLSQAMAQDIYKTVDENGNTVYTDQKPSADAQPVKLKELTVVDPVDLGNEQAVDGDISESRSDTYANGFDLRVVTPTAGETIWNTGYVLTVEVETDREIPSGTHLAYLVDGEVRSTTPDQSVEIGEIYRGEHTLSVELRAADGRVLASDGPVGFFMRQASRLHPNPG